MQRSEVGGGRREEGPKEREAGVSVAVVVNWGTGGNGVLSSREVARAGHANQGWG